MKPQTHPTGQKTPRHGGKSRRSFVIQPMACRILIWKILNAARTRLVKTGEVIVPPRDARCFDVPKGHFFRITSIEGAQVGDLNLWSAHDLTEHFYSGKTRALHGTHLSNWRPDVVKLSSTCARLPQSVTIRLIGMAGMMMAGQFMM
jgi:uncharacterized protein YcgI (DUF1989 family)